MCMLYKVDYVYVSDCLFKLHNAWQQWKLNSGLIYKIFNQYIELSSVI